LINLKKTKESALQGMFWVMTNHEIKVGNVSLKRMRTVWSGTHIGALRSKLNFPKNEKRLCRNISHNVLIKRLRIRQTVWVKKSVKTKGDHDEKSRQNIRVDRPNLS
jgi:hypothetical protein